MTCIPKRVSATTSFSAVSGTTLHGAAVTKNVMWSVFTLQKALRQWPDTQGGSASPNRRNLANQ